MPSLTKLWLSAVVLTSTCAAALAAPKNNAHHVVRLCGPDTLLHLRSDDCLDKGFQQYANLQHASTTKRSPLDIFVQATEDGDEFEKAQNDYKEATDTYNKANDAYRAAVDEFNGHINTDTKALDKYIKAGDAYDDAFDDYRKAVKSYRKDVGKLFENGANQVSMGPLGVVVAVLVVLAGSI